MKRLKLWLALTVLSAPVFAEAVDSMPALNDTGITTCSNATENGLPCSIPEFPGQDAEYGSNGFNFIKIDANGNQMPVTATNHSCVKDNVTGLIWEVKTDDGGLRDKDNWYTFEKAAQFAANVNAAGLCGFNDWRVPNLNDLFGIADFSRYNPSLNVDYFPSITSADYFWTATQSTVPGSAILMKDLRGYPVGRITYSLVMYLNDEAEYCLARLSLPKQALGHLQFCSCTVIKDLSVLTPITQATWPELHAMELTMGLVETFHPEVLAALVHQFPAAPQFDGTAQPFTVLAATQAYQVQLPSEPESVHAPLPLLSQHGYGLAPTVEVTPPHFVAFHNPAAHVLHVADALAKISLSRLVPSTNKTFTSPAFLP